MALRPRYTSPTLLAVMLLLLVSCQSLREPEFRVVENIRVARLDKSGSVLALDIRYFNPNNTRVKLKEAKGSAWLDGNFLGNFNIDTLVNIPANGEFLLPVTLEVEMKKLLQNSLTAFLKKEVLLKIEGNARLGKGIIYINYPFRYEGMQNLEKLLK